MSERKDLLTRAIRGVNVSGVHRFSKKDIPELMMMRGKCQHLEYSIKKLLKILEDGTKDQRSEAEYFRRSLEEYNKSLNAMEQGGESDE